MIGSIKGDSDAERFSDYLVTQSIPNMVEELNAGDGWSVWVENDDHIEQAKRELDAFLKNPANEKYGSAQATAAKIRDDQQQQAKRRRARYIDYRTRMGSAKQWAIPVTLTLMALSIAVSVGTLFGNRMEPYGKTLFIASFVTESQEEQYNAVIERIKNKDLSQITARDLVPDPGLGQIMRGQVWRLVTPMFLHFGILHLLFNMFWLRDLGGMIEMNRRSGFMLALVLVSAIISNLCQYFWSGPWFGGMSGVNYALFGYILVKQKFEPHLGLGLNQQAIWIMTGWLILCLVTPMAGDVANAAHVMGLATGAAIGYAPIVWRRALGQLRG